MYENRVLRRIYGPKRKLQETGEDCMLKLHPSPHIIGLINSGRVKWMGTTSKT
jgi:hypothetical protein